MTPREWGTWPAPHELPVLPADQPGPFGRLALERLADEPRLLEFGSCSHINDNYTFGVVASFNPMMLRCEPCARDLAAGFIRSTRAGFACRGCGWEGAFGSWVTSIDEDAHVGLLAALCASCTHNDQVAAATETTDWPIEQELTHDR